jgi:hypothetical protein
MNLTVQQYLSGLERSVRNLPGVLTRWERIEEDLREHYLDELGWMADVFHDVVGRALAEQRWDLIPRLSHAGFHLHSMRPMIEKRTGLSISVRCDVFATTSFRSAPAANDVPAGPPDALHAYAA